MEPAQRESRRLNLPRIQIGAIESSPGYPKSASPSKKMSPIVSCPRESVKYIPEIEDSLIEALPDEISEVRRRLLALSVMEEDEEFEKLYANVPEDMLGFAPVKDCLSPTRCRTGC